MRGSRRRRILGVALVAAATGWPPATAESGLSLLLDLRLLAADPGPSWTTGGLAKQRFDEGDEPFRPGAALLDWRSRLRPTLEARVVAGAYDGVDGLVDLHEAYLVYRPIPRSPLRFQLRAGAFAAPFSLENTAVAWTSPYTLSFSAINSWFGEELRTLGVEADWSSLGRFRASPHDLGLTAAVFTHNDPAGALVSWRGWSLHDRQTRLFERLPLADLPGFAEDGSFPPQEAFEAPFHEIDGRLGVYAGARWSVRETSLLQLHHYDNRGDPRRVTGGQWAWRTVFDSLGWHLRPRRGSELILQALDGSTRMDGFDGVLVYAPFRAAFLLASQTFGGHRVSLRYDTFQVRDEDESPDDPNREDGHAWTAAYFRELPTAGPGRWRLGVELLTISSDRPARILFGEPAARDETSVQLVAQWRWDLGS